MNSPTPRTLHRRALLRGTAALGAWPLLLAGCARPEPLHIGFLGTLSRRAADLGEAGRNGLTLAIEQRNEAGGVHGQPVRLTIEDDGQDPRQAATALRTLQKAGVAAVVGPFTSAMAAAVLPLANEMQLPLISPTVTSMDFFGRDDHLLRLHRTTRDNATDYARVMASRGQRRIAVALDHGNRSFSESWLGEFRRAATAAGCEVIRAEPFTSPADGGFAPILRKLVDDKPQALLFIANAVDVARLTQLARQIAPDLPLVAAEWAATETLLELGGRALQGLLILQPYDRDDRSPRYRAFDDSYRRRFNRAPGYASVAAFDAATVMCQASERRKSGQSVKQALLDNGPYDGLQQSIAFDRNGDTQRRIVFAVVDDGRFAVLR